MCYKFTQPTDIHEIQKTLPSITEYSIADDDNTVWVTKTGTVLVNTQSHIKQATMQYGFTNASENTYYNARYETVPTRPMWQYSYKHKRCIIPLNSFVEGKGPNAKLFHTDNVLYAAGLYNHKDQFCILTCDALGLVKKTSSRYPLVLEKDTIHNWLNTRTIVPISELVKSAVQPIENIKLHETI